MRIGALAVLVAVPSLLACGGARAAPPAPPATAPASLAADGERFEIQDDAERPLLASVYSLPSPWIDAGEAGEMLAAVRAADPDRQLLAVVDAEAQRRLAPLATRLRLRLLPLRGGPYSPWPRDPFSFARAPGGAVRLIARPNVQRGREADADLAAELVRALPADVDRGWGGVRWARAEVPFHNGQLLLTRDAVWATIHSFEPRVLQLLGTERVPVESFDNAAGIDAYVDAARRAADELAALYGRTVRFVHPLPAVGAPGELAARTATMRRLFGGAGYDLDSLVTLLPRSDGAGAPARRGTALVGDLGAGERLLAGVAAPELAAYATAYRLDGAGVLAGVAAAHATQRGRALASYLDLLAEHLASEGWTVVRLPLLVIPAAVLRDPGSIPDEYFFLGWNNVVVERRADGWRAEGFSSLLPAGDRLARDAFAAAGVRLDLLPPLLGSVTRNGGYRCASNHLRARLPSAGR